MKALDLSYDISGEWFKCLIIYSLKCKLIFEPRKHVSENFQMKILNFIHFSPVHPLQFSTGVTNQRASSWLLVYPSNNTIWIINSLTIAHLANISMKKETEEGSLKDSVGQQKINFCFQLLSNTKP